MGYLLTGQRAKVLALVIEKSGLAKKIRSFPGNIAFELFYSLQDENRILLYEAWDKEAGAEFASSNLAAELQGLFARFHVEATKL